MRIFQKRDTNFWRTVMDSSEYYALAKYNSERSRGIQHTDEYKQKMANLQTLYNQAMKQDALNNGWTVLDD